MNKIIVILCSGGGGNLRFIQKAIDEKWISRWSKLIVIADRECPAINYARNEGIDNYILDFGEPEQIKLSKLASSLEPDLIITTVHRILCNAFLKQFESRLLNLHYSLLPAFSGSIGIKPVQDAQSYGACLIGVTVHAVTEVLDGGKPHVQIALPVNHVDTNDEAMELIFRAGCIALLTTLMIAEDHELVSLIGGHLTIGMRPALINPSVTYPEELSNESFWGTLKS
jgi:phosphoribosylglycinamide formyltransferase 1